MAVSHATLSELNAIRQSTLKIFPIFIELQTGQNIDLHDLTPTLKNIAAQSGIQDGFVTITSQHTTAAITINENEARLIKDHQNFFNATYPAHRQIFA